MRIILLGVASKQKGGGGGGGCLGGLEVWQ